MPEPGFTECTLHLGLTSFSRSTGQVAASGFWTEGQGLPSYYGLPPPSMHIGHSPCLCPQKLSVES